jgi:hypothetical protein
MLLNVAHLDIARHKIPDRPLGNYLRQELGLSAILTALFARSAGPVQMKVQKSEERKNG